MCVLSACCSSRKSLIASIIWLANNDCNTAYSLRIVFLPPQQMASSTSTKGSKITSPTPLGNRYYTKSQSIENALTEILYIIFRECRGRVRVGARVIHFNRAISVSLATFPLCTPFQFHIRRYMQRVCVCQHKTGNNKRPTVVIENCKF